jgi:hypothetical protein
MDQEVMQLQGQLVSPEVRTLHDPGASDVATVLELAC